MKSYENYFPRQNYSYILNNVRKIYIKKTRASILGNDEKARKILK